MILSPKDISLINIKNLNKLYQYHHNQFTYLTKIQYNTSPVMLFLLSNNRE